MAYPPKIDPIQSTWVIAVDFKLDKLKIYCDTYLKQNDDTTNCKQLLNNFRTQIFNTFYEIVGRYDFKYRMQNSLVFNNSTDATKAFKAVSLGIKKSWIKYFIEKIHLFEIDPNSDASELLELKEKPLEFPEWLNDELINFLQIEDNSEFDTDWY